MKFFSAFPFKAVKINLLINLPIFLILVFAAFLRLYKIADYMTFLGDEGRDVLVVYNILHGDFTFLGPTASVGGFFMGPIYYYFMTPFLWLFNYDPSGPAVMVAIFGILTVFLMYKITREFFDFKTAIFSASLYTVSPLVIAYSRSSWNPNLMPFFSLLTMYYLYKGVIKNSFKFLILSGIFLGVLFELHYISVFLGVSVFIYLIFSSFLVKKEQIKIFLKKLLCLLAGFILGILPFLLFELKHGFLNTQNLLKFALGSQNAGTNNSFLEIISNVFFRLFGRLVTTFPPPEQISIKNSVINFDFYFFSFNSPVSYWYFFTLFLGLVSFSFILFKFWKSRKESEKYLQLSLLSFWFIIGIFLFGFYKKNIYDYYFEFMFPLPFIFVGNFLSGIYKKNYLKIFSLCLLLFLIFLNLTGMPFRSAPNRQLAQVEKISRFIHEKTGSKPFNFALITEGNSDHGYRYFFTLWNNKPVTIENVANDPERKTVTEELFIICEKNPCAPLGDPLWEVAGFGRAEIAGEWDVSVVKIYKLIHYSPR